MNKLTSEQKVERDRQRLNTWLNESQTPVRRVTGTMLAERFASMEKACFAREQELDWGLVADFVNAFFSAGRWCTGSRSL